MSETTDRLTAQQIEGRTLSALATIEASWEAMLTPPSRRPGQRTHGTGATLDDKAESDDDTPRMIRMLDMRQHVTGVLNSWCRTTIEDHNVQHGIPDGHDVPALCKFLRRWSHIMAEHEAAEDMLDELKGCARDCESFAPPSQERPHDWRPKPRTMRLGACPLQWQDPADATDKPCPGTLRGDEDGWVRCDTCGTAAVMGWWEQQLPEAMPLMTLDEVRVYVHRQHGMRLTLSALRMWVQRGHLVHAEVDSSGRERYDAGAVEAALTRRQRMPRLA